MQIVCEHAQRTRHTGADIQARFLGNASVTHTQAQQCLLQDCWYRMCMQTVRAYVRFYYALLCSNSSTLAKVLEADIAMSTINKKCWSAEFLDTFHGLERSSDFQHRVRIFQTIPQSQFVVDVRKRLRSIWYQANQLGDEDQMGKAEKYHNWVALPLRPVTVDGLPFSVPRYLHLDLGRQTQRSLACFRLHSHALRVEIRSWGHHDGTCDKCGLQAIQDGKHTLFLCPCTHMCSLRLQFADLSHDLYLWLTKSMSIRLELFISPKLVLKMSSIFSRNKHMIPTVLFQSSWMFF